MAADALSRVFAALADPTRRDMVSRLAAGDATVNQLAEPYQMSLQAVYKHLNVLEDAGVVSRQPGPHDTSSPSYRGNVGLLKLAITHPRG